MADEQSVTVISECRLSGALLTFISAISASRQWRTWPFVGKLVESMRLSYDWLDAAKRWMAFAGDIALDPWVIHGGDRSFERDGGSGFSWRALRESPV